jgi:hypothetical protein
MAPSFRRMQCNAITAHKLAKRNLLFKLLSVTRLCNSVDIVWRMHTVRVITSRGLCKILF